MINRQEEKGMKVGNTKGTINLRQVEEEMLKRHLEGKNVVFTEIPWYPMQNRDLVRHFLQSRNQIGQPGEHKSQV